MVITGLSEVIGSWKIIEMSLPRTARISASPSAMRSRPASVTEPLTTRPGGLGTSRINDSEVIVLPQPDSPTIASVSPAWTANETSSTALTTPERVKRWVRSPVTSSTISALRRGAGAAEFAEVSEAVAKSGFLMIAPRWPCKPRSRPAPYHAPAVARQSRPLRSPAQSLNCAAAVNATNDIAARRARLTEAEAALTRLRGRYDQLMNAFKFGEARALVGAIEAAERERAALAAALPAPDETRPYAVARPRHQRR